MHSSVNTILQNLKACSDSGSATFTITNTTALGGQDLNFSVGILPSWMNASPPLASLSSGDSAVITLHFTSGMLSAGEYVTVIPIHSNDPLNPLQNIAFTMSVDSTLCMDFSFASDTCTGMTNFISSSVNSPTYYYWDFGDGDTSDVAAPSHAYSTNGNYPVTLIGCNGAGCDTVVANVQATIKAPKEISCYPATQSYCCGRGITYFRLTGSSGDVINNSSNDAFVGYEDFSCSDTGIILTNNPYTLTCITGTGSPEYVKVWLDMNNDGMLDSISEELFSDQQLLHSGTIIIPDMPSNVYGVPLRLRVTSDFQQVPQPCLNPLYGQAEDYSLILNFSVGVKEIFTENDLQVYPNPFTQSANIDFRLRQSSTIRLEVFNIMGELVTELAESQMAAGQYQFQFSEQSSGVYFVKLIVDERTFVQRIVKMN
jgi:PKD repeat protein